MTEQYDLILFKTLPDHFHDLVEVAHELGDGHGRRWNFGMKGASSATLFPIDDQEMLLKGRIIVAEECRFASAWSAMQENQRRIGADTPRNQML